MAPLAVDGTLVSVARSWAGNMAAAGGISHNPSLASQGPSGWQKLGENVGQGGNVDSLLQAFVNSPAHYQNLVDPAFNYVGIGVVYGSGDLIFVTVDFMQRAGGPAAGPAPAPAPRTSTPGAPAPRTRRADERTAGGPGTSPAAAPAPSTGAVGPIAVRARTAARARPPALTASPAAAGTLVGMADDAAIETNGLTRAFAGRAAVDGLTLDVAPGEVLALLGPNGAGKTTTIRLLNGVLRPDRGSSRVLGLDPARDGDEVRKRTGVLTETAGLDDRLTALENLVLPGRIRGMSGSEAKRRAREMLGALRHGRSRRSEGAGVLDRSAQARRAGACPAARPRGAVPRRADLRARPRGDARRRRTSSPRSLASTAARWSCARTSSARPGGCATAWRCSSGAACRPTADPRSSRPDCGTGSASSSTSVRRPTIALSRSSATHAVSSACEMSVDGAVVRVDGRNVLPSVVANLVGHEVPVYGAVPRPPTLEDMYFALEEREGIVL